MAADPARVDGLPPPERLQVTIAVSLAVAMATLDTAVVNTALPTIARDIGTSGASSVWVVNAYQLAMVATILPLASLGEILGHRRVFVGGLVLFTATSAACGLAWSLPTLVAARFLQGLGAAAIMSVNAAIIRLAYPSSMLGRGVGLNALVVAVAFTVGPSFASVILSVTTWHWLFLINVPVGVFAIVLSLRRLPVTARAARDFDPFAALLCAGFFALLILGLGGIAHGEPVLQILSEWAAGSVFLGALLWRQADHPAPMLAVDLFRTPVFALSAATSVCSFAAQGLGFVALPFLFQDVMGYSQVETGFLMTPWPAVVGIMAPIAGGLSDRYPPGILGGIGLILLSGGMMTLAIMPDDPSVVSIAWRMALCGAGFGFFQSPNLRALMGSAPPRRSGGASGIVATARLLGQTIGAALVALCLNFFPGLGPGLALWLGCGFAAAGSVASFLRLYVKKSA